MLTTELINTSVPRLQLQDTVGKALQLINDFRLTHLPVVADDKFLGLVSEEDLLDTEEIKAPVEILKDDFITNAVLGNEHFLNAVKYSNQIDSTLVPIVNKENEFIGSIIIPDLLKALGNFAGTNEIGGIIVMTMERSQFAISEISRIVESNDATILHLNTIVDADTGLLTVTLHLNKKEIAAIVASFERYEYDVVHHFGDEKFENEIHTNYQHLMNYLDI